MLRRLMMAALVGLVTGNADAAELARDPICIDRNQAIGIMTEDWGMVRVLELEEIRESEAPGVESVEIWVNLDLGTWQIFSIDHRGHACSLGVGLGFILHDVLGSQEF